MSLALSPPPDDPDDAPDDAPFDAIADALEVALFHLVRRLRDILGWGGRIAEHLALPERGPSGQRDCMQTEKFFRVQRALRWARALIDVFTGRLAIPPCRGVTPRRSTHRSAYQTTAERDPYPIRANDAAMLRIFATRSISEIAVRICIDIGIPSDSVLWPTELLLLRQTPAEWAADHAPHPPPPEPRPTRARLADAIRHGAGGPDDAPAPACAAPGPPHARTHGPPSRPVFTSR